MVSSTFYNGAQKLEQTNVTQPVTSRIRKHSLHSRFMVPEQMLFLFYMQVYYIMIISIVIIGIRIMIAANIY